MTKAFVFIDGSNFYKKVQYVGIPKGQSYGLSKVADDVRLVRVEDVRQFFEEIPQYDYSKK